MVISRVLTGRGADIILIDDPLKPEEALSDTQRQAANDWFNHTLYSRLNDKRHGAIVIIMQRLHEDDLVGHVLAQEAWEVVSFPAIAEADEVHEIETILGPRCFTRRRATRCTPTASRSKRSTASAGRSANTISPASISNRPPRWAAAWSRRNGSSATARTIGRSVSTASCRAGTPPTRRPSSATSRCARPGASRARTSFCSVVFRQRLEYPALKRAVREQQSLFDANVVLIEDKASGTQLIQELITDGCHGVTRYQPTCDKIMRLHAQTAMIENGFVYIPETAPWLAEYLHEMTVFPKGKHDDQVNSTAQFLDWFKRPFPGQGIFEYYRLRAQSSRSSASQNPSRTYGRPAPPVWGRANLLGPAHQRQPGRHHRNVCR